MKIDSVVVVGGAGFIGRHVLNALATRGIRVTVPTRRRESAKHLILLPTVDVVETDVNAPGALERMFAQADAVINLAGVLHSRPAGGNESYGPQFRAAHVDLPRHIVDACRATGVKRLVHMSALAASADAPSEYLRSKAAGEAVVLGADTLEATVLRPSVVFGPEDRFLNTFARLVALFPVIPLACPEARFQPVFVGDVAQAIVRCLQERDANGRIYDLAGPREYSLREIVAFACRVDGRHRAIVGLGPALSRLQAWVLEKLPGSLLTSDNLHSMSVPSVSAAPLPFGITPTPMEAVAPLYLAHAAPRVNLDALRHKANR